MLPCAAPKLRLAFAIIMLTAASFTGTEHSPNVSCALALTAGDAHRVICSLPEDCFAACLAAGEVQQGRLDALAAERVDVSAKEMGIDVALLPR